MLGQLQSAVEATFTKAFGSDAWKNQVDVVGVIPCKVLWFFKKRICPQCGKKKCQEYGLLIRFKDKSRSKPFVAAVTGQGLTYQRHFPITGLLCGCGYLGAVSEDFRVYP